MLDVARTLAPWFQPLDQMTLAIDLRHHQGFVAEEEGDLLGFLTFHPLNARAAELSWLGVRADQQGRGVGQRLLRTLEHHLRSQGVRSLEVSTVPADHDPAFTATNAFYRRQGFHVRQRDEHFYAQGRPRILLRKRLRPPARPRQGT